MKLRPILLLPFFAFLLLAAPGANVAQADIGISVQIAPPMLPIYAQPPLPELGYIWTPGYWAYGDSGYFWVPGTWVAPPQIGYLWTPGYWGWVNNAYFWNGGYWGPTVGFYGGVNYGFGYGGNGYQGGRWDNGTFAYNRAANNFGSVHVASVYNAPVSAHTSASARVSFNGGRGGITARPTASEQAAAHESHAPLTSEQTQHVTAAQSNHALLATQNHGKPPVAATSRPGQFTGPGVVAARPASKGVINNAATQHSNAATQHTNAAAAHGGRPDGATRGQSCRGQSCRGPSADSRRTASGSPARGGGTPAGGRVAAGSRASSATGRARRAGCRPQ
jgi:hypothetical protein